MVWCGQTAFSNNDSQQRNKEYENMRVV